MHEVWQRLPVRITLLTGAVFLLSLLAVLLGPAGSTAAVWWPAAAVSIAAVMLAPRHQRPALVGAVLLATAGANAAAGRPVPVALAFGAGNALEAWLATTVFTRHTGGRALFRTLEDALRLLVAGSLAAAAAGVVAGLGTLLGDADVLHTARSVTFAHAAAVLLAVPLMLLRTSPVRLPRRRVEALVQWTCLVALAVLVFAPDQGLPLTFLPLPLLVWAAVRLPARNALLQLLLLGIGASVATIHGLGPMASAAGGRPALAVLLVQLFLVSAGGVLLPLAMAVQQRREDTARLRASEGLFRLTFEEALVGMLVLRQAGGNGSLEVVRSNPVAAQVLGRPVGGLVGRALDDLVHQSDRAVLGRAVDDVLRHDFGAWRGELRIGTDGPPRWMEVALNHLPGTRHSSVVSAQLMDATERRANQQRLRDLALRDGLTGLPNRLGFSDRVATACRRDPQATHALLFCDLDGFKAVNDAAGHAGGDELLVQVAARLRAAVRSNDTVARLGGDEFVLFCPGLDARDALDVADRVLDALAGPIVVDGIPHRIGVSVGVAGAGGDIGLDAALRRADLAMYTSKASGKGRVTRFEEELALLG